MLCVVHVQRMVLGHGHEAEENAVCVWCWSTGKGVDVVLVIGGVCRGGVQSAIGQGGVCVPFSACSVLVRRISSWCLRRACLRGSACSLARFWEGGVRSAEHGHFVLSTWLLLVALTAVPSRVPVGGMRCAFRWVLG